MSLAALAGFVDAIGFLLTGGFFVSFMSGNSTRLAVAAAQGSRLAILAGGLVGSFLLGVIAGAFVAGWNQDRRKTAVMAWSTGALAIAAGLVTLRLPIAAALVFAGGMGILNNVFQREGEVSVGVTYMTGTLVRAGQRIAGALGKQGPSDWLPYLMLWASLVAGAIAGAFAASANLRLSSWIAALLCALMAIFARHLEATRAA